MGSKSLEFAKGKNAIELATGAEVADALAKCEKLPNLVSLMRLLRSKRSLADE